MKSAYSSPEHTACGKPLNVVEKLEEPTTFLKMICLTVYQGCLREFMIYASDKGTSIEAITLRKLNIQQDCAHNSNFRKLLLITMAVSSAATIAFYGIGYGFYLTWKKKKQQEFKTIRQLNRYVLQQRQVYEDKPGFAQGTMMT
ncbi:hypothetical protein RF11_00078 [Thelohanellus kitauei]|uniref:Uncharacterized protein n=1 Tax=Thelohanellus kitauei TaxID=669202 RepID=A0A0C2N2U9_THEKT|nr:hypothetical protein RF11_00078 [Thelohanellus kitauei]